MTLVKPLPIIETERLRLRAFTPDDLDAYHATIHSDPDVMRYLPAGVPLPRYRTAELIDYFIEHGNTRGYSFMAATDKATGALLGHIGLHHLHGGAVEVGYALGKAHWGGGYATEGARAVMRYGFETLGFDTIIALAFAPNTASRKVMTRLGMSYEGETDHYYGELLVLYRLQKAAFVAGNGFYNVSDVE
jgi:RimJ/RimL family protein N-acetyltransferase